MNNGTLYLIPVPLGNAPAEFSIPAGNIRFIRPLKHFIVEDVRSARRFLKSVVPDLIIDELSFGILNEHTSPEEIPAMLKPLTEGHDAGLLSEARMPGIADPGAWLIAHAHELKIRVRPLVGPSSIFLALAASGFNGQNFSFAGYLPVDKKERAIKIRELDNECRRKDVTQIFIEAPYRNMQMLDALIQNCHPASFLCIATDLTLPGEMIISRRINEWGMRAKPDIHKKPAVFLLYGRDPQ